jgi:hypothetical protein
VATEAADVELSLRAAGSGEYVADLRFRDPAGGAGWERTGCLVRLDTEALLAAAQDPATYGTRLRGMLFRDGALREAFARARSGAGPVRLRLRLPGTSDDVLHAVAWETLRESADPAEGHFLFTDERLLLSRYLDSPDPTPVVRRARIGVRALVAVADPTDAAAWGLAPVDAPGELARAEAALRGLRVEVLARAHDGASVTLDRLTAALRGADGEPGPDVLYLVCHGGRRRAGPDGRAGPPFLCLEAEDGRRAPVPAAEFVEALARLDRRPVLVVLVACQSAGRTHDADALAAAGPRLAAAGVGAVVAMQTDVTLTTVERLMPVFFRELLRDGVVDRALAAARAAVARDRPDWWAPVLFLRLRDGRLWAAPEALADALDRNDRRRMLARVRRNWIAGVLEPSLWGAAPQALGLESRPDAVPDRRGPFAPEARAGPRPLPPGTRIADVFDDADGALLLLGEPGAGKTTLLLELARELLDRAARDEALPIPAVFPLSTWAVRRLPLADWLAGELHELYDVSVGFGRAWVAHDRILPLLDGLDEVPREHRGACVAAVNAYQRSRGRAFTSLVVCSRTEEYRALAPAQLRLLGAVGLRPLSWEQIDAYLASRGPHLGALRRALDGEEALRRAAGSPLLLSVMSSAYDGLPPEPRPADEADGPAGHPARLFAAYVDRSLAPDAAAPRPGGPAPPRYEPGDARRWLAWLAASLYARQQTVFSLERLQPEWLPAGAARRWYALVDRLGSALLVGLAVGLVAWLLERAPGAGRTGATGEAAAPVAFEGVGGGAYGVLDGIVVGLVVGAVAGLFGGGSDAPSGPRRGTLGAARSGLLGWLVVGLGVGATSVLVGGLLLGLHGAAVRALAERWDVPASRVSPLAGLLLWWGGGFLGVAGALAGALAGGPGVRPRRIAVVETLRWSRPQAARAVGSGAAAGVLAGGLAGTVIAVAFGVVGGVTGGPTDVLRSVVGGAVVGAVTYGLAGGLAFALVYGLVGGLVGGALEARAAPNQGIRRSARTAALVGLGTGLLSLLPLAAVPGLLGALYAAVAALPGSGGAPPALPRVSPVQVQLALLFALVGALPFGGYACLSHLALRLVLWRRGDLPLDAVRFLEYAVGRRLLLRVGGGYRFLHELLQDHLARQAGSGGGEGPAAAGGQTR